MKNIIEDLNKIVLKFLEPLDQGKIYETIVSESVRFVKAASGSIVLEQNGILKRVYSSNTELQQLKITKKGYIYKTLKSHKLIVLNRKQIKQINSKIQQLGIKSIILIPLSYKNKSIGVLTLEFLKNIYLKTKNINYLKLLGSFAALRIKNSLLLEEANQALKTRNLFISLSAHELRTPLTSINGYAQLLQNKLNNVDTVEKRWINELSFETSRLITLINNLIEINKIQSNRLHFVFKMCSILQIINKAIIKIQPKYPERKITFTSLVKIDKDFIIADEDKLLQVIESLLDNALKFSKKDVNLSLKSRPSYLVIRIKDQGKGINSKDLSNIFSGFNFSASEQKGMGLALYIAKNIIDQHHGFLDIDSKVNKGTTVELKLRRAKTSL